MLANSHTGLVNFVNKGPVLREPLAQRSHPSAGSFSHFQNVTFGARYDLPAGHELFVDYGDYWFEFRWQEFGKDLPLSRDSPKADELLFRFKNIVKDNWHTAMGRDLYQLLRYDVFPGTKSRMISALPKTQEKDDEVLSIQREARSRTAYPTLDNVVRDLPWLNENGLCLDHIRPGMSLVRPEQHGAFAARYLQAGTVVAPAPLIHLHRSHLDMYVTDQYDDTDILWQGHQLFFNYVYGHPSTSVVLFPFSPAVNLINHGSKERANGQVRWSSAIQRTSFWQ